MSWELALVPGDVTRHELDASMASSFTIDGSVSGRRPTPPLALLGVGWNLDHEARILRRPGAANVDVLRAETRPHVNLLPWAPILLSRGSGRR
jgi:hypothetical protein